ncbi:MAG: alpha/beta fold hydrolase [Pseudomonadota bacterium]
MARLAVDNSKEIYFEHYEGSGPTIVLSHGWGMNARAWDDVIAHLQDAGRSVLTYDHRACGQSDKDFSDVSVAALGSDIVALVGHLSLTSVVLNGWSLGGAVVVDAASKLGNKLSGLILTAGATPRYTQAEGFPHGGTPDDVAGTVAALRADRVNFLRTLYFDGVFAKEVSESVKYNAWQLALQASSAADASLGALAQVDQRDIMRQLSVPALVFAGEADGVVPPDICRAAAGMLSNSTLVEMAGCGHAPFIEDAPAYLDALDSFLEGLS